MSKLFEELDHNHTPLGELILRRRRYIGLDETVYEVKLGDAFLMSSLFTASEEALGRLGVEHAGRDREAHREPAACSHSPAPTEPTAHDEHTADNKPAAGALGSEQQQLEVVVGGLGLGYTAAAVLESPLVRSLLVVEYLEPVIEWHRRGLLPTSHRLTTDARCRVIAADFFASAASPAGFDPSQLGRRFDAVLVDIDHSPEAWLDPANQAFYTVEGLRTVQRHLRPGGVLGLWSNDPPNTEFSRRMATAFSTVETEPVSFYNPLQDAEATQTLYIGITELR